MQKQLIMTVLFTAAVVIAAPPQRGDRAPEGRTEAARPAPQVKADKRKAPQAVKERRPAPQVKADKRRAPQAVKERRPAPPKPAVRPLPPAPPAVQHHVVSYRPLRNTYTIQLNAGRVILFEQRIVGAKELRAKIRMVSNDRPRPLIQIRIGAGVEKSRVDYILAELKKAGFDDVKIIRLGKRTKIAPASRKPARRIKR